MVDWTFSLPGLPKDFVAKDPKLLLPKDFQPNKEFHPKIGIDDDLVDGDDDDLVDVDVRNVGADAFPSLPGSLPRTNGTSQLSISFFIDS